MMGITRVYPCLILSILGVWFAQDVNAHGRLMKPCQRASMWRCHGTDLFKRNSRDMGLFCGGKQVQWKTNGGKCGVCGDAYNARVKLHEVGGPYATGFITETYQQGQQIDVMVELTAPHRGKFFFKICKQTDETVEVTQECLNRTPLKVIENGVTKDYHEVKVTTWSKIDIKLQLPPDMTCDHCVFQWWYTAGNSWGRCPGETKGRLGCGPQETFVNCADIRILPNDSEPATQSPITAQPATPAPATLKPVTVQPPTTRSVTNQPWITMAPLVTQSPATPSPFTKKPLCTCNSSPAQKSQCTVKAVLDNVLGPDFCPFLIENGAPLYYISLFCDCSK
uniref:Uncharacterized protein LOC111099061 n=1 Tax=Crassostrea virginica TaxID=6565 RepID=A0A8B8A3R7_CRAVI|nr:uncharacterized protein LOC111099061 [Crassostrea virginica]